MPGSSRDLGTPRARTRDRLLARRIRSLVIEHSYRAHVGHIGSSLSVAEILGALYGSVVHGQPTDPARDRVILSKGHAALGLFAALTLTGRLEPDELDTFCRPGSRLGVHPDPGVPGVDFGTGSLGHGLSIGTGAALAARMQNRSSRVFVVLSDAELNEGAVWEAAQFAAHHRLGNLVAIVDLNGQQAFGYTSEVLSIPDVGGAFTAFGWDVVQADGHDEEGLSRVFDVEGAPGSPRVVLAKTVFGRGVSFMERQLKWHYLPLEEEQYHVAMQELQPS